MDILDFDGIVANVVISDEGDEGIMTWASKHNVDPAGQLCFIYLPFGETGFVSLDSLNKLEVASLWAFVYLVEEQAFFALDETYFWVASMDNEGVLNSVIIRDSEFL